MTTEQKALPDLPHVIALGNPFEGIRLIGPFTNFRAATDYADAQGGDFGEEWYITPIFEPSDNEPSDNEPEEEN